jgi:hypothetical protein
VEADIRHYDKIELRPWTRRRLMDGHSRSARY